MQNIKKSSKTVKNAIVRVFSTVFLSLKRAKLSNFIKKRAVSNAIFACSAIFGVSLAFMMLCPVVRRVENSLATAGTLVSPSLTLDSTSSSARVSLVVGDTAGSFAASGTDDTAKFNVSTTNYTGYTLQIVASDNSGTLVNGSEVLNSISTTTSGAAGFTNGTWGYVPSFYNGSSNTNYLVSPTTTAVTLDTTSSANTTAKDYTIGLGVKADYTKPAGEYTKTFTLIATANSVAYAITYANNTSDTVTYVDPDTSTTKTLPQVIAGQISVASVNLLSAAPVRDGYSFLGWCDVAPTSDATVCSGTTYAPGAQYMLDSETGNAVTLYAYWEQDTVYMQDITLAECKTNAASSNWTLYDKRDDKDYTVRYINNECWMTQNLRFAGSHIGPELTNINVEKDIAWTDLTASPYNTYDAAKYHDSGNTTQGYWYNYAGASAMTITGSSNMTEASYSICPAGWRLPTKSEFSAIIDNSAAISFFAIAGGAYSGGNIVYASESFWWSSTAGNSFGRYSLNYDAGSLATSLNGRYDYGFYVRCIRN